MRWYAKLYAGTYAAKHRTAILNGIREGKSMPSVYVITRALHSDGLLDIYRQSAFRKRHILEQDPLVIGIALSRREAFEVVAQIVTDLYRKGDSFDIDAFCGTAHS